MTTTDRVKVALVGIGGYGGNYLEAALNPPADAPMELVGIIDPLAAQAEGFADAQEAGIPIFDDLDAFYAQGEADLVVISAPIQYHVPMSLDVLARGGNVLVEKPICATIQEARQLAAAAEKAPGFCAVGYQWSFSDTIQQVKADFLAGRFGRPLRLRTLVFWPRKKSYYHRNSWAARQKAADGSWVLDSPVNNATAHFLHNMFFVIGDSAGTSAMPTSVQGELYRANPVENYDTAMLRCQTDNGAEVLFYTTHAVKQAQGPDLIYEFENATLRYLEDTTCIIAEFADGLTKHYGDPAGKGHIDKFFQCVRAAAGDGENRCPVPAASAQTLCMNGLQDSSSIIDVPAEAVHVDAMEGDDTLSWIEGLYEAMTRCYEEGKLPAELGDLPWAQAGKVVDLTGYETFPQDG
jgi:predicted dehydrogenase